MDIYKINTPAELLAGNPYPGRGIVLGLSPDGKQAVAAYFIMGRSVNSRNRVFALEDGVLYTRPFDESKVADPSLIIYAALRADREKLVVTNGDQTDTAWFGLEHGQSFEASLRARRFEPDAPNLTPRISGIFHLNHNTRGYAFSILKSADPEGNGCCRFLYEYPGVAGLGHFLHTYVTDGSPIPSFQGEPERMAVPADIDEFTRALWDNLDENNKISLYVRYTDIVTGEFTDRLVNKNQ